jgi:delta14-sterol reductase
MNVKMMILGFITPVIAYAVITLLHIILPARKLKGYVTSDKTGEVLNYRLNGILVLPASIIIWFLLGYFKLVPFDWLYQVRWFSLAGAVVIGLVYSCIAVFRHPSTGKFICADFWFGRVKNPQIGDGFIDAKMWLYLIGAVMLQLHVLSLAAFHIQNTGDINYGFLLGCAMLTWFCWDYLTFERVHLYTYDFIAERTGFKLGFGCLAFYPYFYAVSLWFTAELPNPGHPLWLTIIFCAVFIGGWLIARGANMQKFYFKIAPEKKFICIKPEALSDGKHSLLVNGYWGASRHINYLGEILMATGIALVAGYPAIWMVWLYPLYYVGLLFSRQADDDKVCKAKYGELWDQYKKRVKYRIIPFIY